MIVARPAPVSIDGCGFFWFTASAASCPPLAGPCTYTRCVPSGLQVASSCGTVDGGRVTVDWPPEPTIESLVPLSIGELRIAG